MTLNLALETRAALADRYRVGRELSADGTAGLFLARDLEHDRDVAITEWRR